MIYNQQGIILDSNSLSPGPVKMGDKLFRDMPPLKITRPGKEMRKQKMDEFCIQPPYLVFPPITEDNEFCEHLCSSVDCIIVEAAQAMERISVHLKHYHWRPSFVGRFIKKETFSKKSVR